MQKGVVIKSDISHTGLIKVIELPDAAVYIAGFEAPVNLRNRTITALKRTAVGNLQHPGIEFRINIPKSRLSVIRIQIEKFPKFIESSALNYQIRFKLRCVFST